MKKIVALVIALVFSLSALECRAQKFSLSTNFLDYLALGTLNMEASYSISRKYSLMLAARYNPFTFAGSDPEKQFQLRQQSYAMGVRMWPWHTWSGWWFAGKLRYQEYNFGGLLSRRTSEGDRAGLGLYAGYTHMLGPHLNIEFGAGFWGGADFFRTYSCQVCGITEDEGTKAFILPDDIMISLVYVF